MTFTINDLTQVVREDELVKELVSKGRGNVREHVSSLIADMKVSYGLQEVGERISEYKISGRPEKTYKDTDLYRYLKMYVDAYGHLKMNIRKAVAYAILNHLRFMGVTEDQAADNSPEALRRRIFGITD